MEETSFKEAIMADYIVRVQDWPRDRILQELLDVRYRLLELTNVNGIVIEINEQRPK